MAADVNRNFSGWSAVPCHTCQRRTTKAEHGYSKRFYGKSLCRSCQKLEKVEAES